MISTWPKGRLAAASAARAKAERYSIADSLSAIERILLEVAPEPA